MTTAKIISKWNKIRSRAYDRLSSFGLNKWQDVIESEHAKLEGQKAPTTEKAADWLANDMVKAMLDKLDNDDDFKTDEERAEFLGYMWYNLGGIMSYVGSAHAELNGMRQFGRITGPDSGAIKIPKWMMLPDDDFGRAVTIFDEDIRPNILDHLHKVKIEPDSEYGKRQVEGTRDYYPDYISHPYNGVDMSTLKELIKVCEKYGIDFSVDADSMYFPGHTVAIKWWYKGRGEIEK